MARSDERLSRRRVKPERDWQQALRNDRARYWWHFDKMPGDFTKPSADWIGCWSVARRPAILAFRFFADRIVYS